MENSITKIVAYPSENRIFTTATGQTMKKRDKITALLEKIPQLANRFSICKEVGEGTFSTVYLASLKSSDEEKIGDKTKTSRKLFAIKHLIPTSNPERIRQELWCLSKIGGTDNVVQLLDCLRQDGNIAIVMPYLPHRPFISYILDMSVNEVRQYMKNLLLSLRRVHSFNIIHRDVKPNNFLYNRKQQKYYLVDFGLAHEAPSSTKSSDDLKNSNDKKRKRSDDNDVGSATDDGSCQQAKKRQALQPLINMANMESASMVFKKPSETTSLRILSPRQSPTILRRHPLSSNIINVQNNLSPKKLPPNDLVHPESDNVKVRSLNELDANIKKPTLVKRITSMEESPASGKVFQTLVPDKFGVKLSGPSYVRVQNSQIKPVLNSSQQPMRIKPNGRACKCDSRPQICNSCILRRRQNAPRAGTAGYRPPEVLLRHKNQTTAVDIWAAGVILLSILSGRHPFFRCPDDMVALAEMMTIFGTAPLQKLATKLGKRLICGVEIEPLNLKEVCQYLRKYRLDARRVSRQTETVGIGEEKPTNSTVISKTGDNSNYVDHSFTDPSRSGGNRCDDSRYSSQPDGGFFPDSAYDLLYRMLDLDPDNRITAADALQHPFILEEN